ncbi:hypothetical protein [Streptomyces spiramyceticus]|uniref:hypothetical protein n=1 Tax=Streptomyces spiramyceticus TaxID=299717 RepID=UPI00237C0077|nr:hypothetical protein [Streptomyces spiramyceticus]
MNGLLRGTAVAAMVLANALNAYIAFWALHPPQGAWDESSLTAMEVGSFCVILIGVTTLLIAALPVMRRALSGWWLAPPAVFVVLGMARWSYIATNYPQTNGA